MDYLPLNVEQVVKFVNLDVFVHVPVEKYLIIIVSLKLR